MRTKVRFTYLYDELLLLTHLLFRAAHSHEVTGSTCARGSFLLYDKKSPERMKIQFGDFIMIRKLLG